MKSFQVVIVTILFMALLMTSDAHGGGKCKKRELKEQCHENFAVFGQFFNYKQNASVKLQRRYQMNVIREG